MSLDSFDVFFWDDGQAHLVCERCEEDVCTIDEGDSLGVLVSMAEDHKHECAATGKAQQVAALRERPLVGDFSNDDGTVEFDREEAL